MAVNREKYSFPVGKVDKLNMYPMDFEEFLWALGKDNLAEEIRNHYREMKRIDSFIHDMLIDL